MSSPLRTVLCSLFLCLWGGPATVLAVLPGVRIVPVPGNDLEFSSTRNQLYVAVAASGLDRANTLTTVNPDDGSIIRSIPLPAEPVVLAMSRDERYLYAGLMDGRISRIDLDTELIDLTFSTAQTGVASPRWVVEIEVLPDRPESIVATVGQFNLGPREGCATAVFDSGVMRPEFVLPGTGVVKLTFGSDSNTLWGYNTAADSFDLYRFTVTAEGISANKEENGQGLFRAFFIDPLFHNGNVIAKGYVFEPVTKTMVGRYYAFETIFASSFAMDKQTSKIYFPARSGYEFSIAEYDLDTYRLTGYFSGGYGDVNVPWSPEHTVTCGSAGIAMSGYGDDGPHVTIFPHSLFSQPAHWTPPTPVPLSQGIRRIPLENNGIVGDPIHGKVYASLGNWFYDAGNSVAAVDCVQGTVSNPVYVGADPWQMAVSAESKYLYVALYNGWGVQRLKLPELIPDQLTPIKSEKDWAWGIFPARVNQIVASPDSPEIFAVARAAIPGDPYDIFRLGVALYEGGVKKPKATDHDDDPPCSIQFGKTGSSLYGFVAFREFSVTDEGVSVASSTPGVTTQLRERDLMACQYGICFTPSGHIIDGASQERLGEFAFDLYDHDFGWAEGIIPDLDRGLVYFLSYPEYYPPWRLVIEAYDVRTRHKVGKLMIPNDSPPTGFVKWRDDQLAVGTNEEVILFPLSLLHDRPKLAEPVTDLRPAFRLIFPFLEENQNSLTGVAVTNLTSSPAKLNWFASDGLGMSNQFQHNSVASDLPAGTQWARTAAEIFGSPLGGSYAEMSSDNPGVSGFFLQRKQGSLDGATAVDQTSRVLYFTRVTSGLNTFRGKTARATLWITNPNGFAIDAELVYTPVESAEHAGRQERRWLSLPSKSVTAFDLNYHLSHWNVTSGHVRVEVKSPRGGITGYETIELWDQQMYESLETLVALNAVDPGSATRYYSAQLAVGSNIFTSLKLVNVSDAPRHVILRAIGENGQPLTPPAELDIEPNKSIEKDVNQIFAFGQQGGLIIGSLIAESDAPGIVGDVVFGDPTTLGYSAAMSLQSRLFKKAVFGHVANVDDFFTGLALFNPGSQTADIDIAVFAADGHQTGATRLTLAPGQRIAQVLTELMPSTTGQAGGFVVVKSPVPLVGQQMFGNYGLTMLSAVPPNVLEGEQ